VESEIRTYDDAARASHRHRFHSFEPDLNTENPAGARGDRRIAEAWLRVGIAGYRIDAAPS